jgi:sulfoxide reductase heme-binding subunit YedZ
MLGLFTFFYATLHLVNYVGLWMTLDVRDIAEDVAKHPWVWIGVISWALLLPLAITSTKGWVRRLGGKRWQRLHRLVYVVAVAGLVHFFLAVKRDVQEPTIYALVFATLLGVRLLVGRRAPSTVPSRGKERAARPSGSTVSMPDPTPGD